MGESEYVRRTAITRLDVSPSQSELLRDTVAEWKRGCQIAIDQAWDESLTKSDVQQRSYDDIREETKLSSQHAILATHNATEALNSCLAQRETGQTVSKPRFTSPTVRYDARTMTLFEDETVSLTTTESRIRCPLVLPDHDDGYQYQYLTDSDWEVTESTLHRRDEEWFLHLGFRKPRPERPTTENGTVLGVDLGVAEIAVTSTGKFFSAAELNHRRREFKRIRGQLYEHGTRNAHRTLESVSGREDSYIKHVLHSVANGIVAEALEYDCDGIVLEDLDGIRERLSDADWHSWWAFERIHTYIEYKALSNDLFVETVSANGSSHRCAECGFTADDNRPLRDRFECQHCGNRNHADYNAAKNIAEYYLRREQQSSRRRGVGQYALKSGTVSIDEGFTPYVEGPQASTDKSNP